MNRTLILFAALIPAVATVSAQNAPAKVSYNTSAPTWSGFHAGVNLGGGFGDNQVTTTGQATANVNNVNGGARPASVTLSRSGVMGGAQVGYGRQFHHFYLGAETDLDGAGLNAMKTVTTTALTGGGQLTNNFNSNLQYLGTARARVGYVAGRVLLYGSGGFAYGQTDQSASFTGAAPTSTTQFVGNRSAIEKGYAAGGGAEYRVNRRFSLAVDYLRFRLEDETLNVAVIAGSGGGGTGYNSAFENKGNTVTVRANYRF